MLDLIIPVVPDAHCGNPLSPSGHVWSSTCIPPADSLRCMCGRMTWKAGVRRAYQKRRAEHNPAAPQMNWKATS